MVIICLVVPGNGVILVRLQRIACVGTMKVRDKRGAAPGTCWYDFY
jgi:hypothetical protein